MYCDIIITHDKPASGERDSPFDVETKYFDAVVILALYCFLACIELFPLIDVFTARIAPPADVACQ